VIQTDNCTDHRPGDDARNSGHLAAGSRAVARYREAAEKGCADSQALLGLSYLIGLGVARDLVSAQMWLEVAAAQGCPEAVAARDLTAPRLTGGQLEQAQRLALAWLEQRRHWLDLPTAGSC
jgi:TPR repeat protein